MPVPFLDTPARIAFAHRGGAAHAPENSWTAFEHAVKLGYAYLETDARATSDGRLMAFHDRTLDRVTDAEGPIGSKTYREVTALRVAGSEPIPLIEDLLGAWPEARFNIDLKDEPGIALLPGVLRRTGAWDRVCVTSFSGAGCGPRAGCSTGRCAWPPRRPRSPRSAADPPGARRAGTASQACSPAGWRGGRCAVPRCRAGWPPGRSCAARTPSASTCTCGPSTTGPR